MRKYTLLTILILMSAFLISGCIYQKLSLVDRMVVLGLLAEGVHAIKAQDQPVYGGGTAAGVTTGGGGGGGTTPTSQKLFVGTSVEVTQFVGPYALRDRTYSDELKQWIERDYNAFYGMVLNKSSVDFSGGLEYKVSYYDKNGHWLFDDNYIWVLAVPATGEAFPFILLYDPYDSRIASAYINDIIPIYYEGMKTAENNWDGDFRISNVQRIQGAISGKLVDYAYLAGKDLSDTRTEVVVTASLYNASGDLVDVVIDDGGRNHKFEWTLNAIPGVLTQTYITEFEFSGTRDFSSYKIHITYSKLRK